jgi:hypothetical protein
LIDREQLLQLAELYDLGYQNFDESSEAAKKGRLELTKQLEKAYETAVTSGSTSFRDFKRETVRRIKRRSVRLLI